MLTVANHFDWRVLAVGKPEHRNHLGRGLTLVSCFFFLQLQVVAKDLGRTEIHRLLKGRKNGQNCE